VDGLRLRFESNLDYQLAAIESVCDLFRGQETFATAFTTLAQPGGSQSGHASAHEHLGTGNRLSLLDEDILANLREIQLRNGLDRSERLDSYDFTVEMETGTGKTYVYLRTIFELNRRFGFTKFVIVVPSIAIKEGVCKTIQITREHFRSLFGNTPLEFFLYDSGKLGRVLHFATSPHIQIMVVTVGAINKQDVNNLYKDSEKTGGEKPIDLIRATRPIVIVDEPQSVDGGLEGQGRAALGQMSPLCTLRYSATHVAKHHMVFRLDAVDAHQRGLVKQVEVASAAMEINHNTAYLRFLKAYNERGSISARVELDVARAGAVIRVEKTVRDGDNLEQLTGRAVYTSFRIGEIRCGEGRERIAVQTPGGEHWLAPGTAIGAIDESALKRLLIRRTIKEQLEKELRLVPLGIKVLSLFFIDRVERYRQYDVAGAAHKGEYAEIFEREYDLLSRHPNYRSLFLEHDAWSDASQAHGGYFSQDRRGAWSDTAENTRADRESAERAYHLIMTDKEKLLGFETRLRFIFSHSALREGWDNPNVFQICTLREIGTERERRQTIGRGLRLCVNQRGERLRGSDVNTLTVIATENYEQFAAELQKEFEQETGIRFGAARKIEIKNADQRRRSESTPSEALDNEELRGMLDRINQNTAYGARFDCEVLLTSCTRAIRDMAPITEPRLEWRKAELDIGASGVHAQQTSTTGSSIIEEPAVELPDVLSELEANTQLTRRSLALILRDSERLGDFQKNPRRFIDLAASAIDRAKRLAMGCGVLYRQAAREGVHIQEFFEREELTDFLEGRCAGAAPIGVIKIYAELSAWCKVATPLGQFSPDWAVRAVTGGGAERVYLVAGAPRQESAQTRLDRKPGGQSDRRQNGSR
jgi:restriction endonuclease